MSTIKFPQNLKFITRFFSDENLTKKASLNALASGLDYGSRLLVGFIITPYLVVGLEGFFYGALQVLTKLIGYISPTSGRPAQALKWTLANQQISTNLEQKRRFVGCTIAVWAIFLPIMIVLGSVVAWFAPLLINDTPQEYFWILRISAGILVVNLIMFNFTAIPQAILDGENLGYKRMGLSTMLIFLGGGLTWLALYLDTGIIGVVTASLIITLFTGILFLRVVRHYAPWFGVDRPSFPEIRQFIGLSSWFLGWHLVIKLLMASDVVLLGFLISAEIVTVFSLTKYAPVTVITIIAIIVFGIAPGLGGIIGSGNKEKASKVRAEIMSLTWLLATVLGASIIIWNQTFLRLWVGEGYYAGLLPTLLIVVVATQFVFIRNDANIIDLTLRLKRKVILGFISAGLSICLAGLFVAYFNMGIVGLCLGFIFGRSILSIDYPLQVSKYLGVSISSQLITIVRPFIVTSILYLLSMQMSLLTIDNSIFFITGWLSLAIAGGVTVVIVTFLALFTGLSSHQRERIFERAKLVVNPRK